MPVKSLDELKALRDKYKSSIIGREVQEEGVGVRISVGMATCGIASGARDTINAIINEVANEKLQNVTVVQTGCMGYCYAEPTVEVRFPGKEPVLYGKVDVERAREIVKIHAAGGEEIKEWEIERK